MSKGKNWTYWIPASCFFVVLFTLAICLSSDTKMKIKLHEEKSFDDGYKCAIAGLPVTSCPHTYSISADAWKRGWIKGTLELKSSAK